MENLPLDEGQIVERLYIQRGFIMDENTGDVTRRLAWTEIDRLLGCLQELKLLERDYEQEN